MMKFLDDTIVAAGDGHCGFIALYLTNLVELFHFISYFDVPFFKWYFSNAFAYIRKLELNQTK